ncbi:hypothetical protein COAQ111491_21615 [Comamonas aquatilis]
MLEYRKVLNYFPASVIFNCHAFWEFLTFLRTSGTGPSESVI